MRSVLVTTAVCAAASLAGCGGETPQVCQAVDELKSSVADVRDLDLRGDDDLNQLTAGLEDVDADLEQVREDAGQEYADQIDAMTTSFDSLRSSVEAFRADSSQTTLAEAGAALAEFRTAAETFADDVGTTC